MFWKSTSDPSITGSLTADRVIGADGPSSTIRSLFVSNVQRTYAGYCALRGTVPEREASPEALEAFAERFTFYHGPGVQILAYLIPGLNGTVEPGQRLVNFVYYTNFPAGSAELEEILTDRNGQRRRITMPPGMTDPAAWERQRAIARERLPPQFAEIVCKAKKPFVQAVTDVISPEHEFLGGKVVLIGDALRASGRTRWRRRRRRHSMPSSTPTISPERWAGRSGSARRWGMRGTYRSGAWIWAIGVSTSGWSSASIYMIGTWLLPRGETRCIRNGRQLYEHKKIGLLRVVKHVYQEGLHPWSPLNNEPPDIAP